MFHVLMALLACAVQALLILMDGPAALPAIPLHQPLWYGLYYVCTELGTLRSSIGRFMEEANQCGHNPAEQLRIIGQYKPTGIDSSAWDAMMFTVLHRATVMKRLVASHTPDYVFLGPVAAILSDDQLGAAFIETISAHVEGPVTHLSVDTCHTDFVLKPAARTAVAAQIVEAAQQLLQMV